MSFSPVRGWRIKAAAVAAVLLAVAVGVLRTGTARPDATPGKADGDDLERRIADAYPDLKALYERLHRYPELSSHEELTAARLAAEFPGPSSGFVMTREFGGHGLVAELHNGDGPTVLVRTEMDALPVEEKTGLPYASRVRVRDRRGTEVGVMHACGHDVHMTCWVGTARMLAQLKDRWHGTLVFIAQPGEETGSGAEDMLEAGLFRKFPRPDYCLALHCDSELQAGDVSFTHGLAMANVDMVDITVRGKGGHAALPHMTIDPVVMAARLVLDLQTLVSRENNPTDPLVVTVGSIHGGTKHNVIPDEVRLQLTVRSTSDASRKRALEGIGRLARAVAAGAGAPEPILNIHPGAFTPALVNNDALTDRTVAVFRKALGEERVHEGPPRMLGEDFAVYGRQGVPIFLYFLGTQSAQRIAEARQGGRPLPSLHSDLFQPAPEPTIKTGVRTMTLAVLNLLGKKQP
jgi:hippurate hydrolase